MAKGIFKPKSPGKPALMRMERRGRGHGFTIPEREAIYQAYLALGSKIAVARSLGLGKSTVHKVIREIEANAEPLDLEKAREKMSLHLTGRLHETTNQILDSIKPEDVDSGRIPIRDAEGNLKGYTYFGPSLLQKATTVGIFTDKMKVLADYSRAVATDQASGTLIMPETAAQLISAIRNRVASISVLNVNFKNDNPDLATRLEQVMEVAAIEETTTNGTDSGRFDFDNPA